SEGDDVKRSRSLTGSLATTDRRYPPPSTIRRGYSSIRSFTTSGSRRTAHVRSFLSKLRILSPMVCKEFQSGCDSTRPLDHSGREQRTRVHPNPPPRLSAS